MPVWLVGLALNATDLCPLGQKHVLGPVIAHRESLLINGDTICRPSKLSLDSGRRRFTRTN